MSKIWDLQFGPSRFPRRTRHADLREILLISSTKLLTVLRMALLSILPMRSTLKTVKLGGPPFPVRSMGTMLDCWLLLDVDCRV